MTDARTRTEPERDTLDIQVFQLPASLRDSERYAIMYEEMIVRLRREAEGLDLNTLQTLLIERLASGYVVIRAKEDTNSWVGTSERIDLGKQWSENMKQFQALLQVGDGKRMKALLDEKEKIMLRALDQIEDPENRKKVSQFVMDEWDRRG